MKSSENRSYVENFEVKEEYGAKWLKVFYHDASTNEYFNKTTKDYLFSIENEHKYSVLKYLKNINKYERRKYEFLLEYPQYPGEYNRWKQSTNPATSYTVEGFDNTSEGMHTSWPNYWSGLKKTSYTQTFIRGCSNGWWFYSIGAFQCVETYKNTFPGPILDNNYGLHVTSAYLWVRVPSFANMFDFHICTYHCRRNSRFSFTSVILSSIIYS